MGRVLIEHFDHLLSEGFTPEQISALDNAGQIDSIDADQARERGFKCIDRDGQVVSGSGLYFRFSDTFGQLRLDEPIVRQNGSLAKYLSPAGRHTQTLDPGGAMVWTEGAKDAWAGTLHGGVPTGALCGVADWRKLPKDKRITLIYDSDAVNNPQVLLQLVSAGVIHRHQVAFVPRVEGQPKAGLCEWFRSGATAEHYRLLIDSARKPEQLLWALPTEWEGLPREQLQPLAIAAASIAAYAINRHVIDGYLRQLARLSGLTLGQLRKIYQRKLAGLKGKGTAQGELRRLPLWEVRQFIRDKYEPALNELSQQIEVNGRPLDSTLIEGFKFSLAEDHRVLMSQQDARVALVTVAATNAYNPVTNYLYSIESNVQPLKPEHWERISERYLGATGPLDNLKLQKWLIGAIARAFEPGCRMQEALILVSNQGKGKSSFFSALGGDWFSDSLGELSNIKDDILTLHRAWIHEWAEFDKVTGKREANDLKAFVSRSTDHCRPPYKAQVEELPRRCVLCGTTNRTDFLVDPTGSRRYPCIRVTEEIHTELVFKEREEIWAAAIEAYKRGDRWWYNSAETALLMDEGKEFAPEDPWQSLIEDAVGATFRTTVEHILVDVLKLEPSKQNTAEHRRVTNCLRRLGWEPETNPDGSAKRRKDIATQKVRRWWFMPQQPHPASPLTSLEEPSHSKGSETTGEVERLERLETENQEKREKVQTTKRQGLIVVGSAVRIWCPTKTDLNHRFHGRNGTVTRAKDGAWFDVLLDQESRVREFPQIALLLTASPLDLNGGFKS